VGIPYWNIKSEPDEIYLGWEMYYETQGEIGQTTGMFPHRGRAIKNGRELIFFDKYLKSRHKVRNAIKEQAKKFDDYLEDMKNNR